MLGAVERDWRLGAGDLVAPATGTSAIRTDLVDLRFRTLVGEDAWAGLPEPVRRRFSKRVAPGSPIVYRGIVVATEISRAGRVLSFLARAIGAPLPLDDDASGAATVTVSEDTGAVGQIWTRAYARPSGGRQVIRSMKCFSGPTGLEELVGAGIGMALAVTVEDGALHFRSDHYFLRIGRRRLRLPRFLEPGRMEIVHEDAADGSRAFSFRLTLTHPLLGRLLYQDATFGDPPGGPDTDLSGQGVSPGHARRSGTPAPVRSRARVTRA